MAGENAECRAGTIAEARTRAQPRATVRTETLVRKRGQRYTKHQPITVHIASCPIHVGYPVEVCTRRTSQRLTKMAWLVLIQVENVDWGPWLLLTDHPVTDTESAVLILQMCRTRWAVEDCLKFTKDVLDWEDVQMMDLEAIRTLAALGWVAASFLL